jgi:hypothetical protein
MKYSHKLTALLFSSVIILSISGCKSKPAPFIPSIVPVKKQDLTEEQAINICKSLLSRTGKTVTIPVHYYQTTTKRVACTQYDVDGGIACSAPEPGAPYGYKNVADQELACCEQKNIPLYNTIGNWSAEYSNSADNWTVTYQFNADDMKYHFVWTVDDNNSNVAEVGLGH